MKIVSFKVENFRGVRFAEADNLAGTIIIAGQNGSGKSCLFDALRLVKSVYGGYQQNEWHQWMGEFAINVNSSGQDLEQIFNNKSHSLTLEFAFELHNDELNYLTLNAESLLIDRIWKSKLPDAYAYSGYRMAMFAQQFRELEPEVRQLAAIAKPKFLAELAQVSLKGAVRILPGQRMNVEESEVLPVIFSLYKPKQLGLIDFHGAQRHYGRENVSNVNISLDQSNQVQSASALYNYAAKYANVKSEMAASYMREILAEQAGVARASQNSLTNTLKELFETFFPDKKFLGPIPTSDGGLSFPVITPGGSEHDLDDLSAGEKEILYGYLRIRSSAPRFSIILIDEPELHLNPRLIRGLPQFYRKNLGIALDNQIWLVTHSDALLREAVGRDGFNVFHMQPCTLISSVSGNVVAKSNQLKPLEVRSDVDAALTDLVGDLAAFQPDRKVVIFEGGGDTDFDKWMTTALFPEFANKYNLISGSNKNKVQALHEVLNRAYENGEIKTQFYAIVDSDYDDNPKEAKAVNKFVWPVYHIENFLLEPAIISQVVSGLFQRVITTEEVIDSLKQCARSCVPRAIRHKITEFASRSIMSSIDLGFSPTVDDVASALHEAVSRSSERVAKLGTGVLSLEELKSLSENVKLEIEASFGDGSWLTNLPGRDLLRAYANMLPSGISHEILRNMIVNRMEEIGHKPDGMREVVVQIMQS